MGFFDSLPPPEPPEPEPPAPPRPSWMKSDLEIGGAVPAEMLLARGEKAAVGLTGLLAYPNGFEFTIAAVLRDEDRRGRFQLGFPHDPSEDPPAPEFLRVGVRFADGGVATNLGRSPHLDRDTEPAGPILTHGGGGGGGRRYDLTFWLSPLPPPGPVTFIIEWPAFGVPESHATLDAGPIRDAAGRAIPLWAD